MADHDNLVGSETDYASQKRIQRGRESATPSPDVDIVHTNVRQDVQEIVHTDIRDKILEIRDKSIDTRELEDLSVTSVTDRSTSHDDVERVREAWNAQKALTPIRKIQPGTKRDLMLRARIREYGIDSVLEAVGMIPRCPFLMGKSKTGWMISFDWFVRPNNFPKVLEGNYLEGNSGQKSSNPFKNISDDDW